MNHQMGRTAITKPARKAITEVAVFEAEAEGPWGVGPWGVGPEPVNNKIRRML